MAPHFRALISVPITASNDTDAMNAADELAHSIRDPVGGGVAVGHVELLGELRGSAMEIARVVHAEPAFLRQLPPDWKP